MAYWVVHEDEPDEEDAQFHGEFFDTYVEALAYCKVKGADHGRTAELFEAYECGIEGCERYPRWGMEFCDFCREC